MNIENLKSNNLNTNIEKSETVENSTSNPYQLLQQQNLTDNIALTRNPNSIQLQLPVPTTIPNTNIDPNTNSSSNPNKRSRLPNPLNTTSSIQQKRHNSQSSINNQFSNKRGAHFPLSSPAPNAVPNLGIFPTVINTPTTPKFTSNHSTPQLNSVITSQYPFVPALSQQHLHSFKHSTYRHSNTPTIITTLTNNHTATTSNQNFTPSYNLNLTPAPQPTPKLHHQLLQSSAKRNNQALNQNKLFATLVSPDLNLDSVINQNQINYYSKQINSKPDQLYQGKSFSQSPDSFDNKYSGSSSRKMFNPENITPQMPQQVPQQNAQSQSPIPPQPAIQQVSTQQPQPQRIILTEEEQLLISNLQETYKAILKLEVETQQGCAEINQQLLDNNTRLDLNEELWIVYKNVIQLLDHYYDFLLYALSPASTRTGKPLVSNYRILKRMWVYGIVAFLEVLKNVVAICVEHDVCSCFVSYSFNIISCLTDPELGIECWWAEKLGDLSRMAIALYPAKYMDWKMSSVFWYQEAIKTQFGHGKIYYHMCSVENDNLEALMLIGKGVNCRDPFVPTQQYLRMIVDNVCSQRNILTPIEMAMIDFVKIHKILLLPAYNTNEEMINIVSHYSSNFGVDNTHIDFFQIRPDCTTLDINDKITFWYQKGANFALSNIYHLIGFGICSNPFAKLFDLPDALKERKDKKERREKRRRSRSDSASISTLNDVTSQPLDPNDPEFLVNSTANKLDEKYWFLLLEQINKGVLELSMKMFKQYLSGPIQTSTSHAIVWLYFLISVCESVKLYPSSKPMFYKLFQAVFPWKTLVSYLNDILCIVRSVPELRMRYKLLLNQMIASDNDKFLFEAFSNNETLWEVWKCWGSLWFDRICPKGDYSNVFETGIKNNIFDTPLSGEIYKSYEDGERYLRILLLGGYICRNFTEFGLKTSDNIFKFEPEHDSVVAGPTNLTYFSYFLGDSRLQPLLKLSGFSMKKNNDDLKANRALGVQDEESTANQSQNENDETTKTSVDNEKVGEPFNFDKWTGENESPKLPMWDYNSYGFMTDFINNQYPAVLAHRSTLDSVSYTEAEVDNEYEEDSTDEYEENGSAHKYQHHENNNHENFNERYEVTSEGGSVNANAPLSSTLGTFSDEGNDDKGHIIKGDIGGLMDTSITFISLDTNVWLKHCGRIFKCVRSRIFKLAIPLTVFQELRSLRKSSDSLVAESATRAVIIARQLYSENVVLATRSDGTTASHINETREFEQNENWRLNSDELILQSIKLNDAFGKSLKLGYGYSVGELPKLPVFEEPGKVAGVYNGSYRGGYATSHFPTTLNPTPPMKDSTRTAVAAASPMEHTGIRGESLRTLFISSKSTTLNKSDAAEFRYNILITDDNDMILRAESLGLKHMRSSEWFKIIDKISFGRCYD